MHFRDRSLWLWIFSFVLTVVIAYYQHSTGPTYPVKSRIKINGTTIRNELIRTWAGPGDADIDILIPGDSIRGFIMYKRYKSNDAWTEAAMQREGDRLVASLPHQPPAGKIIYHVYIEKNNTRVPLTAEPVIIRFRGDVPAYIMVPHVIIIFLAMLFSTRAGAEAIFKGPRVFLYTKWTILFLFVGGLILGPIVQKYSFGAFWTGWPFGHDLTDNKTLVSFILWVIAYFVLRKHRERTGWAIAASIVLLLIFFIPHSTLGSELNYAEQQP